MKCFEIIRCSAEERSNCFVWNCFKGNPEEMDDIRCWIIKGAYQGNNRDLLSKCLSCKYYKRFNQEPTVTAHTRLDCAIISCEGSINNTRAKAIQLIWDALKKHKKYNIIFDLSNVSNIYSCGFGALVQIHKDSINSKGILVVICPQGYVRSLFVALKLHRVLNIVDTQNQGLALIETLIQKQESEKRDSEKKIEVENIPKCWEYWKNHNPRNATGCNECWRKAKPSTKFCWLVEGEIEGVTFQYVNEDCETCEYYLKYGSVICKEKKSVEN